jgi:hypothetical protein
MEIWTIQEKRREEKRRESNSLATEKRLEIAFTANRTNREFCTMTATDSKLLAQIYTNSTILICKAWRLKINKKIDN